MENRIKILPQSLSNKIAAGEVVGRPESVAKELLENSIDAGADNITLIIREAGKTLIQVIDNGDGMNEEDAVACFQRHSTSKIATYEDLENILTLGFRGEALSSICSVSQVELKTKVADAEVGTLVRIEGNEVKEVSKTQSEKGTSIAVKNLFYNTPGRRNFLKSNQTEFRHIYDTFIRLALSHSDVSFTFINNDEVVFELAKASLHKRLKDVFSDQFANSMIPVGFGNEIVSVKGMISKPNFTKKSRQDQYFYLNSRFIQSKSMNFAVYSGYDHLIEKGDYPSFFLFIEIDPQKVDVNVHPSKLEVKFEEESAMFGFIRSAVKDALQKADIVFEIGFENKLGVPSDDESLSYRKDKTDSGGSGRQNFESSKGTGFSGASGTGNFQSNFHAPGTSRPNVSNIHSIFQAANPVDEKNDSFETEEKQSNIFEHQRKGESEKFNVWQYQNKYIMCQTENGLMIIDQHAAHERVLYERALMWLNSQSSFSQQLLIPITVRLTKIDYQLAVSLRDEMQNLGFNFNALKDDVIELTGIPSDVRIGDENKIFQELIDQYKEYELKLNLEKRDNLAKSFACKSAIKTGDTLTVTEMLALIDSLFASQMPYVCPHGRPTVIRITTDELDKRFSRT